MRISRANAGARGQLERKKLTKISSEWESILGGNKGEKGDDYGDPELSGTVVVVKTG